MKLLLDGGSDANCVTAQHSVYSKTPLQLAVLCGHFDVVKTLTSTPGVDINASVAPHVYNAPPIFIAAANSSAQFLLSGDQHYPNLPTEKRLAIVQALIDAGASTCWQRPLIPPGFQRFEQLLWPTWQVVAQTHHLGLYPKCLELIRWVVISGQNPTLLRWLIQNGHHDGVNLDEMLMISAWELYEKCAEILVECGADPDNALTMLADAVDEERSQTVELLRRLGAKGL